jgi:hypothetical protein
VAPPWPKGLGPALRVPADPSLPAGDHEDERG